jgi:hypothetical protein
MDVTSHPRAAADLQILLPDVGQYRGDWRWRDLPRKPLPPHTTSFRFTALDMTNSDAVSLHLHLASVREAVKDLDLKTTNDGGKS